jgi:hypothetical protein
LLYNDFCGCDCPSAWPARRIRLQIVADSAPRREGTTRAAKNDAPQRQAGAWERVDALYFPVNFAPRAAKESRVGRFVAAAQHSIVNNNVNTMKTQRDRPTDEPFGHSKLLNLFGKAS